MDINRIREILPHRFPFLLVDKVLEIRPGFIVAQKCITVNEWFFQGHFPEKPVCPGVLLVEMMAQTGAILAHSAPENKDRLMMLAAIDDTRFRKPVVPGDVLRIEVTEVFRRKSIGRTTSRILVNDEVVCEATITYGTVPLKTE